MTVYSILLQQPDTPLVEKWVWGSDIPVSNDGTEQRISLSSLPQRAWTGVFTFSKVEDVRRHLATMFKKFALLFDWPAWHNVVKLKQSAAAAQKIMRCNPARSDFRVGAKGLIIEGDTFETFTVNTVLSDRVTSVANLTNAYSPRALLCPVMSVYSMDNSAVARRGPDNGGSAQFAFYEYGFLDPFILEDDKVELTEFNSIPVINMRPMGVEFNQTLSTGATVSDYGGLQDIRSQWNSARWNFALAYLCQRMLHPEDWTWWRTFADYTKGSIHEFYVPSWRADMGIYTPAVAAGTTVTLDNIEYGDHYYPVASFRAIMFTDEDGAQHFANVTNRAVVSGRDVLTFAPALPAGDWPGQVISFLLKCRISDDTVSTEHQGAQSIISLNVRTVD